MDRPEPQKPQRGLAVLLLALIALLVSATVAAKADGDRVYRDGKLGWTLTIPAAWSVNDKNPATVVFMAPPPAHILLMLHIAGVKSDTLPALVDSMIEYRTRLFASMHLSYEVTKRASGALADGTPWAEIEERLGAGGPGSAGYARLRCFLVDHTAFALDGESYESEWPAVADTVATVLASFRPPAALPPAPPVPVN
jgi:hypothetical protein